MITLFDPVHILAYAVAFMLIGTFFVLFYIGLTYYREQDATREGLMKNAQLASVMRSCKIRVWLMRPHANRYILLSERGTVEAEFAPIDFSNLYKHTDFDEMRRLVTEISEGRLKTATCRIRSKPMADGQRHMYDEHICVLEYDAKGRPMTIIGLQHDISDKLESEQKVNNLLMLYHTIFDSSIINTMFYDSNGRLSDINETACETFGIKDRRAAIERGIYLSDVPAYKDIDLQKFYGHHMVSITDIGKEREKNGSLIPEITLSGKLYYDTIVNPIYDEQGKLVGVYTAGRSINEMVESYHRQQEGTRQLKEMTQQMQEYIDNINIALRVSEVRLMNYLPDTHEVEISNDLNTKKLRLTQIRCFTLVSPEHRHQLATMIRQMDRRVDTRIDMTVRSTLRDHQGRDVWLTFSLIPMKCADGSVSHYFGMCRNETEMVSTAALLKEESRKAQETELLKDAFLQNMSYEIRTPLSAVLGFAELLNSDHSADEETVFIDQIKKNANLLLQLVNDILFISRLDAHMVEIKTGPTDFAMLFDGWCHQGWTHHNAEVSTSIENPYDHLIVDIDDTNLGIVINRLCANAAAMTTEGAIRAKYEYRNNQIIINIQDTGNGFNESESKRLFERFAKNRDSKDNDTGLALPIAKGLVEQMGGTIDFQSEPGKGSIAWVTIPATAILAEWKDISTTA